MGIDLIPHLKTFWKPATENNLILLPGWSRFAVLRLKKMRKQNIT